MTRTLSDLYVDRCTTNATGKLVPHFWQPQAMTKRSLCLFADETRAIPEQHQTAAELSMKRLIALGLELEIDVGKFVLEQARTEVPKGLHIAELLKSAVADEARHELGFKLAKEQYGIADVATAKALRDKWVAMADKYQPLAVAGVLEQEIFLVTLGIMRLIGGAELNDLAMQIAKDESRHVATNRAITKWLKVDFGKDIDLLVDETLDFAIAGLDMPITSSVKLDYDFCVASSRELRATGTAKKLDRVTRIAQHKMPFEVSNSKLYASRTTEDGKTVY